MAAVMIGVDPHKGSHTAVAISGSEELLGQLRVRASAAQASKLLEWAAEWPERTWAVEGAGGLGHLLAQQLLAAGEQVAGVQPKLGARVRLLSTGTSNKNDPNDARSVAVAALRSPVCTQARADDHALVLRVWSRRHRQLSRLRTQAACRLHAALCEITPAASPRSSPRPGPPPSWAPAPRPGRSRPPGTTWPPRTWPTCAASTSCSATPGRRSPP